MDIQRQTDIRWRVRTSIIEKYERQSPRQQFPRWLARTAQAVDAVPRISRQSRHEVATVRNIERSVQRIIRRDEPYCGGARESAIIINDLMVNNIYDWDFLKIFLKNKMAISHTGFEYNEDELDT